MWTYQPVAASVSAPLVIPAGVGAGLEPGTFGL